MTPAASNVVRADLGPTTVSLATLAPLPRWVAWQTELRGVKPTKMPYYSVTRLAKANDPRTWMPRVQAEKVAASLPKPRGQGGVGIVLGQLDEHVGIGGIDYDSCLANGAPSAWAQPILREINTYIEVSPSGTGLKSFFTYRARDLEEIRAATGVDWGRKFTQEGCTDEHGPAIEPYLGNKYFTTTGQQFDGCPDEFRLLDAAL